MNGTLFTSDFLIEGIKETDFWREISDDEISAFKDRLLSAYEAFPTNKSPNESTTEQDLIEPILKALGWNDYLPQQTASHKGRSNVPDYLLFRDSDHKSTANKESIDAKRYKHGVAILEAKSWLTPLDRKTNRALGEGVPSNQILRYLSHVDVQSNGHIKWGILTNGREWRLYYQDAKSRSEEFLSLDLPVILNIPGIDQDLFSAERETSQDWLKLFYILFRKESFIKSGPRDFSFHQVALEEGRHWESKVAEDLSETVFEKVLPGLAQGLADGDPNRPAIVDEAYLSKLREATMILLYRLLFLLYAEDRNLLPVDDSKYDDYGLRKRVRKDINERIDENDVFSETLAAYYRHVIDLCRAVDKGDTSIGLPPYNGGLFDEGRSPLLLRAQIPDAIFAPLFDRLSRHYETGKKSWINYRDLSVQELGSIYERFLEYELVLDDEEKIVTRPNIFSRKTSGSYYTPDSLVSLVIDKTVGPLIDEKVAAFFTKAKELKSKRNPKKERLKELAKLDPANQILKLRICDPAMGSGHFLVSLVDYLADRLLILVDEAESKIDWADEKTPYVTPIAIEIKRVRDHIFDEAKKHNWIVKEDQLDDRHIVRRMILKRCVYGVDKNRMAVELSKVALWLHTFTVGAPLSFLDHHLRHGDSLFGEFTYGVEEELYKRGSMFIANEVSKAKGTAKGMAKIEALTDSDIAEVKESAETFNDVSKGSKPLTKFFDFIHASRWIDLKDKNRKAAVNAFFDQTFGDPVRIALKGEIPISPFGGEQKSLLGGDQESFPAPESGNNELRQALIEILDECKVIAGEENFLHWEVAFPMVWEDWESDEPEGGFDAVIGNPPWDKMRLEEVPWFAIRDKNISYATRGSDRKKLIKKMQETETPLASAYDKASLRAKASTNVARNNGQYPLLSVGDINLYSLFVERAHRLVKRNGFVGLLVPSGIASDKGASNFFKSITTNSRLGHFYDFENKKVFFPDIHASFKFSAYIAGGVDRHFDESTMAFFLHDVKELEENEKTFNLQAKDFIRVNPNTGTAPIFRTRRDAEITRRIYENYPILHKHGKEPIWPVKYSTMFHMTNDSKLFKTKKELETDGFYPVEGNRLKKSDVEFVPLYEGKMVQAYDHRAASVVVNPENLHRPGQPKPATVKERNDPAWMANSQYWVDAEEINLDIKLSWYICFKDITASTNMRTMIATIIPRNGANHKLPLLLPKQQEFETIVNYKKNAPILIANLNAFSLDYLARQKVQATNLTWYIVEQLPVIPPEKFEEKIGDTTVADLVRDHVLRLTYTANDMKPFARDMGYDGEPFIWDEEERRHLRARLDALFFNLYNINRDDADYILSTFPIVQKNDEKEFGRYITRDLILAYMNALKAGDTASTISI